MVRMSSELISFSVSCFNKLVTTEYLLLSSSLAKLRIVSTGYKQPTSLPSSCFERRLFLLTSRFSVEEAKVLANDSLSWRLKSFDLRNCVMPSVVATSIPIDQQLYEFAADSISRRQ